MRAALLLCSVLALSAADARAAVTSTEAPGLRGLRLVTEAPSPSDRLRLAPELYERQARELADFAQAMHHELAPLDPGGGAGGDDAIIGFILAVLPGFGLGHLVVGDDDGFVFYLLVDVAVVAGGVLLSALVGWSSLSWAVMVVGWLGIHVMQGLDAYRTGGGRGRLSIDWSLPPEPDAPLVAAGEGGHVLAFSF